MSDTWKQICLWAHMWGFLVCEVQHTLGTDEHTAGTERCVLSFIMQWHLEHWTRRLTVEDPQGKSGQDPEPSTGETKKKTVREKNKWDLGGNGGDDFQGWVNIGFFPSQKCERHRRAAPLRTDRLLYDVEELYTLLRIISLALFAHHRSLSFDHSLTSGVTSSLPWTKWRRVMKVVASNTPGIWAHWSEKGPPSLPSKEQEYPFKFTVSVFLFSFQLSILLPFSSSVEEAGRERNCNLVWDFSQV